MNITPVQRTVVESALYITSATIFWYGRHVSVRNPITLQYVSLLIAHLATNALSKYCSLFNFRSKHNLLFNSLIGISVVSCISILITIYLKKEGKNSGLDKWAFVNTTFTYMTTAILVHLVVTRSWSKSKPKESKQEKIANNTNEKYSNNLKQIVTIQSYFRGYLTRKQLQANQQEGIQVPVTGNITPTSSDFYSAESNNSENGNPFDFSDMESDIKEKVELVINIPSDSEAQTEISENHY